MMWWMAEAPGGMGLPGRTRVSMALVMPPPRTMSTLAISMIASVAGSIPVVSMSMTRINRCASWLGGCKRSRSRRIVPGRRTWWADSRIQSDGSQSAGEKGET